MPDDTFEAVIQTGDMRDSLIAIRDYLAHELGGHRCKTCAMSQLRTGDTAALVLRLQKVLEEIEAMPAVGGEVSKLDELRAIRDSRRTNPPNTARPVSQTSPERRQGGRRPRP